MTTHIFSFSKRLNKALIELLIAALPAAALFFPVDIWAQAQPWPNRVVKIVVGGNPGQAADTAARLLAEPLSAMWGQPVVVENRPSGPAGNLAAQYAAQAKPDGYTLKLAITPELVMNQYLFKSPGFDAEKDFAPIIRLGVGPMVMMVNASLPIQNMSDLAAWAKARPGKVFYATPGVRFMPHFLGEAYNQMAGAGMTHVPYKTGALAAQDTVNGDAQIYVDSLATARPWMDGTRLRPIAVFAPNRLDAFVNVPTAKESGYDLTVLGWSSLVAPTGTPKDVIDKINRDVNIVLARPDIKAKFPNSFDMGGSVQEFEAFLAKERKFWEQYVRTFGFEKE